MLKIGEFSKLSKTTIKTLRFYDDIDLFHPAFIDENGYRYYEIEQLNILLSIVTYRKLGLSLKDIKKIMDNSDKQDILNKHLQELINQKSLIDENIKSLQRILKEGIKMQEYKIINKVIPEYDVYYRHGIIKDMSKLVEFILQAGGECRENNPTLECIDYCYVTYAAKEYKEKDVEVEYVEAVKGKVKESKNIKAKHIKGGNAIVLQHKGSYENLSKAYAFILNYIKDHNLTIVDDIREVYIDGCWNKDNEDDYLTEIQVLVK